MVDLQLDTREVDGRLIGFLEAKAERTKTSGTLERKVRFLPVAIPLESMVEPSWVPTWLELRESAGLQGKSPHPMLPSPQLGGGWAPMPLLVGAAGDWLRSLLKIESVARDRVATHSCKATLLAMSAKYGIDYDNRRFLGYHSEGKDRSLLTYSHFSCGRTVSNRYIILLAKPSFIHPVCMGSIFEVRASFNVPSLLKDRLVSFLTLFASSYSRLIHKLHST